MAFPGPEKREDWRTPVLGLFFFVAGALLVTRLWFIQIRAADRYEGQAARQSIRRVLVPSPRGRILDRYNVVLADDRLNACLGVYMEELRQPGRRSNTVAAVSAEIQRVCDYMGIECRTDWKTIWRHSVQSQPMPLIIAEHLTEAQMARFAENMEGFAGIDILDYAERHYPYDELASHVIGYVRRTDITRRPDDETYHYSMKTSTGTTGLERQYDARLGGTPGVKLVRVNAAGYRYEERIALAPSTGEDLRITLDVNVQRILEDRLRGQCGAGVLLDPRNGDVLALASAPGYDLNKMTPSPSREYWHAVTNAPERPLFNRATQGQYPPGSTFKPVVAVGALQSEEVTGDETYHCTGSYPLKPKAIRCAFGAVHGYVNMRSAIRVSCNGYFCWLGQRIGYQPIYNAAAEFGIGSKTGIDLPFETTGLLPNEAWKLERLKERWYSGDTSLISIGQGTLLASPLQMAVVAAAIANGGRIVKPRLVADDEFGTTIRMLNILPDQLNLVRSGMADVIRAGSGRGANPRIIQAAGKTGTAEYMQGGLRKKYAWMIAYAPLEDPSLAIAVIIEDAESGGLTVAPVIRDLLTAHFGVAETVAGEGDLPREGGAP